MRNVKDFGPYSGILPYASEIFGVYQPMLGWRSKRILDRIKKGFANDRARLYDDLYGRFVGKFDAALNDDHMLAKIQNVEPAKFDAPVNPVSGSFVMDDIANRLPALDDYDDGVWDGLIDQERIQSSLTKQVVPKTTDWYRNSVASMRRDNESTEDLNAAVADQLNRESAVAGYLLFLKATKDVDKLKDLFYKHDERRKLIAKLVRFKDPLDIFDPKKDIGRVSLSPIGIVHLFRQYFFEFDTFLGPPVEHVWMSPGATVELVEVSTRKTIIERTFESTLETTLKKEKSTTEEDEISEAVKQSNQSDTKFGMNATANQGWVGGSASASASINMGKTQSKARETSHRHMRQQSDKLSTEIRKNFKSTFRTISEETDMSSKRFVLSNTTEDLINYELRRKMRQVGVQVQDIGTYLCWQTYVDDPGRQLGVSELVHIAKRPDVGNVPQPDGIPMPQPTVSELAIDIPFVQKSKGRGDLDEGYRHGREVDTDFNEGQVERIQDDFGGYTAACEQPGFKFDSISWDFGGNDVRLTHTNPVETTPGKITFGIHLDYVNFRGNSPIRVTAKVKWVPLDSVIDDINTKNQQKTDEFTEKERLAFETAFIESARDRIKVASNIEPRKFEEMREEERIVVYRMLIQDMLTKDIPMPDDRTRHVVSELLNTIFDIDKMLYFVAPEWWRPRLHQSHQDLGGTGSSQQATGGGVGNTVYGKIYKQAAKGKLSNLKKVSGTQLAPSEIVSWGGAGEGREDNYYITEDSTPAKLGSSLGWLLQLDGDNMRNAFLNAPWVKAVIPIRPGRERAAMNWLQQVHVEGTQGLGDDYVAPPDELAEIPHAGPKPTVQDAIFHLCDVVKQKHEKSLEVDRYPKEEINDDNRVSASPIDKVYEHGFYPLQGGFSVQQGEDSFEVFDQWVEVLPTDQVVPVEVTYDPKTGRQL
jgi:hypothetical protein